MKNSFVNNPPPRELPAAIAHEFARTKWSNVARMELLNRLFVAMSPLDQLACKIELMLCRRAMRGELKAQVS